MKKAIGALVKGYEVFRKKYFDVENSTFAELVNQGQSPKVLMIACSDSRVDPALVMNCKPGDLFVLRNVANLVPPYENDHSYHGTSAALEFGVCVLGVQHIILFGHTQCGGIQSLLDNSHKNCLGNSFLNKWMELAKPSYDKMKSSHAECSLEEQAVLCGQYSLVNSINNLLTFPWIEERVNKGVLALHAWNFDMTTGVLNEYDRAQDCFKMIGGMDDQRIQA